MINVTIAQSEVSMKAILFLGLLFHTHQAMATSSTLGAHFDLLNEAMQMGWVKPSLVQENTQQYLNHFTLIELYIHRKDLPLISSELRQLEQRYLRQLTFSALKAVPLPEYMLSEFEKSLVEAKSLLQSILRASPGEQEALFTRLQAMNSHAKKIAQKTFAEAEALQRGVK